MSANTILARWNVLSRLLAGICKVYKHSKHIQNSNEERTFTPLYISISNHDCNALLDTLRELAIDGGRLRPELQVDVDGIVDGLNQIKTEYCQLCSSNLGDEVIVEFLDEFRNFITLELVSNLTAMKIFDASLAKDWTKVFHEPFAQEGEHLIHTLLYTGKKYGLELEDISEILAVAGKSGLNSSNKQRPSIIRSPKPDQDLAESN